MLNRHHLGTANFHTIILGLFFIPKHSSFVPNKVTIAVELMFDTTINEEVRVSCNLVSAKALMEIVHMQ